MLAHQASSEGALVENRYDHLILISIRRLRIILKVKNEAVFPGFMDTTLFRCL